MSNLKVIALYFLLLTILGVQSKSMKMFKELGEYEKEDTRTGKYYLKTYYHSQNLELDWPSALSFCKAFNMNLVTLDTKAEHDYFLNKLDSGFISDVQVLIGGTDIGDEGNFYWASSGKPFDYPVRWVEDEPKNYGNNEHCIGLWKYSGKYEFNDVPCTGYSTNFVCELEEEILDIDPRNKV